MNRIVTLTTRQLVDWLFEFRGAKPASVTTETQVEMRKTGNPFAGRVTKICVAHVFVNFNYANSVNTQRRKEAEREGTEAEVFAPDERKWGTRIRREDQTLTPLVRHVKDGEERFYLECRFLKSEPRVVYRLDRISDIDKAEFEEFLPGRSSGAEHQGLSQDNEVIMRDYNVGGITRLVTEGWDVRVVG